MGRNLLTLEGCNNDFLGWGISSITGGISNLVSTVTSTVTNTVSNTTQIVKEQVDAAIKTAQEQAAQQLQQFKDQAAAEMAQIKQQMQDQLNEEMAQAKEMLQEQLSEKWELTKELKINQLSTEIMKDISLTTLEEYAQQRSDELQDKLNKLELEYIKTGYDNIKEKIKTDLKAELKNLLVQAYLKITGQEIPEIDLEAETQAALAKINEILMSDTFQSGVINTVSTTLNYAPASTTIDFIKLCIADLENIDARLENITSQFPYQETYVILECITYVGTVLTTQGEFIVLNKDAPTDGIIQTIIQNTPYVPGINPFEELIQQEEQKAVEATLLPTTVQTTPSIIPTSVQTTAPTTTETKIDSKILLIGGAIALAGLFYFMKRGI